MRVMQSLPGPRESPFDAGVPVLQQPGMSCAALVGWEWILGLYFTWILLTGSWDYRSD